MANEWETVPLRQLIESDRGITYGIVQPGVAVKDGVPIVRVSDVRDGRINTSEPLRVSASVEAAYARSRLAGGELLLTLVGTVGETAVVPASLSGWNTARAVAVIPVSNDVGAYWIRLVMQTPGIRALIDSRLNTTVQATLNLADVGQLPIVLPPAPERAAIARVAATLDGRIELNRTASSTLEAMARTLFESWFVDFDPVRARADGRDAHLPAAIADLFPDRLVDSEIGPVPQGWTVGTFGAVAELRRHGAQPDRVNPETPYIALEHMPKRSIALSDWGVTAGLQSNKFTFKRGDVLFGKLRPYFHKVGVAPVDGLCSTDILVIAPKEEFWFGPVLGHASSEAFVRFTSAGSTGTKMPRTGWSEMARYPIAIPPIKVCEAFTRLMRPVVERLIVGVHESRRLIAIRDGLVPKLVSGELRVPEIDRFVSTAI